VPARAKILSGKFPNLMQIFLSAAKPHSCVSSEQFVDGNLQGALMNPSLTTDLSAIVREMCGENVYLCYQCERCSLGCPTALAMRYRPAQMMRAAQFGLEDLLDTDASPWRCLGCDTCATHCPHGVSVRKLVEVLRQRVMQERYRVSGEARLGDDEALYKGLRALGMLGSRIEAFHNVSGEDNANRLAWTENLDERPAGLVGDRTADMAYFVGCVSSMFPMTYPIPQAFTNVLGRAGVRFTVLGPEEWCCGFPQMMGGQLEQAKPLIQHNVERMRALGIPRVVATCPSCYHMWKHVYPEMVEGELGFEVVHAVEVLSDLVASDRLQLAPPQPGSIVTYHDPCDLGRKGGLYDAPRRVLEAIPDCQFIEMAQSREHALCCGGGGDMETFDPNILAEVSARRIAQAAEIGANYLISACPQCVRTLQKAAKTGRLRIKVMDITQFVEMAIQ